MDMKQAPTLPGLVIAFAIAALLFGLLERYFAALPRNCVQTTRVRHP